MNIEQELIIRSENKCELCGATDALSVYAVPSSPTDGLDASILTCSTCHTQLENKSAIQANHWRCLNDSMWSEVDAVKVVVYRMLHQLRDEGWPQDLLDMILLEDEIKTWADASFITTDTHAVLHRDSNGVVLSAGDTVVLIKDLNVKGAGFTAKRGTAVRNIRLVAHVAEHIEGKVNGQTIVILTEFTKKS